MIQFNWLSKRRAELALLIISLLILISFQNCSEGFSVNNETLQSLTSLSNPAEENLPPVVPPPPVTPTTKIASGYSAHCALTNGQLKCWGNTPYSSYFTQGRKQLGTSAAPQIVFPENVTDISMYSYDSECHILNGAVICSGGEWDAEFNRFVVSTVIDAGATRVEIANRRGCALVVDEIRCWTLHADRPPAVVLKVDGITDFSTGESYGCAIITGGAVRCWGVSENLSNPIASGATKISVSRYGSACAIVNSQLLCWSSSGLVGFRRTDGTYLSSTTPVLVAENVLDLAVNKDFTQRMICVVKVDTSLVCWGEFGGPIDDTTVLASPETVLINQGVRSVSLMSNMYFIVTLTTGQVRMGTRFTGQPIRYYDINL